MRVTRLTEAPNFRQFSIIILFEEQRDVDLFRAMLRKFQEDVKAGGLYANIISDIRRELPE